MAPDTDTPTAPARGRRDALEQALGVPFFEGNRLTLLENGEEIFDHMLAAIDNAVSQIDFLTFAYWRGDIAGRFSKALASAAARGVEVRALLDGVGGRHIREEFVYEMERAGVDLRWFRPVRSWFLPWRITHRTHRKILVCDGSVGFTGGVGIGGEWEGDANDAQSWRDTHLRVEGSAVRGLTAAFLENWFEVLGADEVGTLVSTGDASPVPGPDALGSAAVQVVRSTASIEWSDIATLVVTLLSLARRRVRLSTPYFVPDPRTLAALEAAASRGVRIDLLVPGPYTDQRLVQRAGEGFYERLLEAGVFIWQYQPTFIHQKVMVVDDDFVSMGSANLNRRSLVQDDEIQIVIEDGDFVQRVDEMLDRDFGDAIEVDAEQWSRRGVIRRTTERLLRYATPQM